MGTARSTGVKILASAGNCDKKKIGERGLTDDENERKKVGRIRSFFSNVGQYESERAVRPF